MLQPWEISVLVYHYLQKYGFNNTRSSFNKECPDLQLTDPPPKIFCCALDKILLNGDLESRLNQDRVSCVEGGLDGFKIENLEQELSYIRKKLRKRKNSSSHSRRKTKHQRVNDDTYTAQINNDSLYSMNITPQSNTGVPLNSSHNTDNHQNLQACTPDKRLSSSRRKNLTPKKLPCGNLQGSFVQTLADNINDKNEVAALDTLNQAEPWLEQFISSLSQDPAADDQNENANEEAALSLLRLNNQRLVSPEPQNTTSVSSFDKRDTSTDTINQPSSSASGCADTNMNNVTRNESTPLTVPNSMESGTPIVSTLPITTPRPPSTNSTNLVPFTNPTISIGENLLPESNPFDPIVIKNSKTLSAIKNNPNIEIITLPPISSKYVTILPKPPSAPPDVCHARMNTPLPFIEPSFYTRVNPQLETEKFFGRMKPYHQEITAVEQFYLVGDKNAVPPPTSSKIQKKKDDGRPAESFSSWDQKIRQSIAETSFKEPNVPSSKKGKGQKSDQKSSEEKQVKDIGNGEDSSGQRGRPKKTSKNSKKESEKQTDSKKKKKEKKGRKKKRKDSKKKTSRTSHRTPEFVDETSLSGTEDLDHAMSQSRPRFASESDTMMADTLLKTLAGSNCGGAENGGYDGSTQIPSSPKELRSPMEPGFVEENANPSFDIIAESRPKPVHVPEGSHKSCPCHSNYESSCVKSCEKKFSFKDQDNVDSPRYYNENSENSVTVANLFPSITPSQTVKVVDTQYRNPKLDEDSDNFEPEEMESDEEVRENTSILPPVSSQNKDLSDSSEDEKDPVKEVSTVNASSSWLTPPKNHSLDLSESDLDSPAKQETYKDDHEGVQSPPRTRLSRRVLVGEKQEVCSKTTSDDAEEGVLTSTQIHNDDPKNVVIDGQERVTRNKSCEGGTVEDSCDSWYQNLPNKMQSSFLCAHCKRKFPSLAVLTVHNETCSRAFLICTKCGRKCSSKAGLTNHQKSCQINTHDESKTQNDPKSSKKEKNESSKASSGGEKTKIRISGDHSTKLGAHRKSFKKKKVKDLYHKKDIDALLANLHYSEEEKS